MNIFQSLKLYWSFSGAIKKLKGEFMTTGHSWLSTRFWLTAIATATTIWGQFKGFVPQPYGAYIQIAAVGIYTISETIRKIMLDFQAAKAGQVNLGS